MNYLFFTEPKKEKTEQNANGALSPGDIASNQSTTGNQGPGSGLGQPGDHQKPNRPITLEASRMLTRRLIMLGSEFKILFYLFFFLFLFSPIQFNYQVEFYFPPFVHQTTSVK